MMFMFLNVIREDEQLGHLCRLTRSGDHQILNPSCVGILGGATVSDAKCRVRIRIRNSLLR